MKARQLCYSERRDFMNLSCIAKSPYCAIPSTSAWLEDDEWYLLDPAYFSTEIPPFDS